MFDDTVSKIISDPNRDTVVEVPEYETEVTYSNLKECWKHIIGTPFYSKEDLMDMDEDYELLASAPLTPDEIKQQTSITNEFIVRPFLHWILTSSSDTQN